MRGRSGWWLCLSALLVIASAVVGRPQPRARAEETKADTMPVIEERRPAKGLGWDPVSGPLLTRWREWLAANAPLPVVGPRSLLWNDVYWTAQEASVGTGEAVVWDDNDACWLRWTDGEARGQHLDGPARDPFDRGRLWRLVPDGVLMAPIGDDPDQLRASILRGGKWSPVTGRGADAEWVRSILTARLADFHDREDDSVYGPFFNGPVEIYDGTGMWQATGWLPRDCWVVPGHYLCPGEYEPATRVGDGYQIVVETGLDGEGAPAPHGLGDAPPYEHGQVTVITVPKGSQEYRPNARVKVYPSMPRPLNLLGPAEVEGASTHHGLLLPDGAGIVYTWRGQMATADGKPVPMALSSAYNEALAVQGLVVEWRDGTKQLLALRAVYCQSDSRRSQAFLPTVVFTLGADGRAKEWTAPEHLRYNVGGNPATTAWQRLQALGMTGTHELLVSEPGVIVRIDLSAEWARHGR